MPGNIKVFLTLQMPSSQSTTLASVASKFTSEYVHATPKRCKIVDAYLVYVFLTGVMQFIYCCLVGTFPFNAFLSGFISSVGCFVLAVCLRLQVKEDSFIFCHEIFRQSGNKSKTLKTLKSKLFPVYYSFLSSTSCSTGCGNLKFINSRTWEQIKHRLLKYESSVIQV